MKASSPIKVGTIEEAVMALIAQNNVKTKIIKGLQKANKRLAVAAFGLSVGLYLTARVLKSQNLRIKVLEEKLDILTGD